MTVDGLVGQEVDIISFDFAIHLETVDGSRVRLAQRFSVQLRAEDEEAEIIPESLTEAAFAVLRLVRQRIVGADVTDSGTLAVRFAEGALLSCPPHPDYEAWEVRLATGEMVLSTPGGEIASWGVPLD